MIYFIKCGRFCKIGTSLNPQERLKELQTGSPHKHVLKATIPGNYQTENALHLVFCGQHVTGEWFRYDGPVLQAILGILDVDGPYYPVKNIKQMLLAADHLAVRQKSNRLPMSAALNRKLRRQYERGEIVTLNKKQTKRFEQVQRRDKLLAEMNVCGDAKAFSGIVTHEGSKGQ